MQPRRMFSAALAILTLVAAGAAPARAQADRNILVIIADDVGVDMIGAYQALEGSQEVPPTPTIDSLAAAGIIFRNLWTNPFCATTRATVQTGRYSYRTGVLGPIGLLQPAEFSIAEVLNEDAALGHSPATFGKWGLGVNTTIHPVQTGYDFFQGRPGCCIPNYTNWDKHTAEFEIDSGCDPSDPAWHDDPACIDSSVDVITHYATTENVDDTLRWLEGLPPGAPWFVVLSFNAAHSPFHVPPAGLHGYGTPDCSTDRRSCYRAMIEAMDSEIERLLGDIPSDVLDETTVIFMGDNGSVGTMAAPPFVPNRAKGSLYEGGVNTPLIISGAHVTGPARVSEALVNSTDLFMTVVDLLGVDPGALPVQYPDLPTDPRYNGQGWAHDSFSVAPIVRDKCIGGCSAEGVREYTYSELGFAKTIRNRAGYKLMVGNNGWQLYSLGDDPFESTNLVDPVSGLLLASDPDLESVLDLLMQKLGAQGEAPNLPPAQLDPDGDGVADDGDDSGDPTDNPCTSGQTLACDDNCAAVSNPDQGDADGDGLGDLCDVVCDDGVDNDGDGEVDFGPDCESGGGPDCGCESAADPTEKDETGSYPCDDGMDNDRDGLVDFGSDSGCKKAASPTENPRCNDGQDNDGLPGIDFDGGSEASRGGARCTGPGMPYDCCKGPATGCSGSLDNQCLGKPWSNSEAPTCGLGFELALLLPFWMGVRRRRICKIR